MLYLFGDFELDTELFELRRAGQPCPLEPQVFDLLAYLVQHHQRLVPKQELLDHIWPERYITEAALNSRVMAARKAVGDSGREQRVIKTVHGRGYRFVGEVRAAAPVTAESPGAAPADIAEPSSAVPPPVPFPGGEQLRGPLVGRDGVLARLEALYEEAAGLARRRIAFLTGEPGLGKSTVVDAFVLRTGERSALLGRGQCLDFRGAGEPYLAMLEALGRICHGPGGEAATALLARVAPSWVAQMPWLLAGDELAAAQARIVGPTRERMLREMVEALEAITASQPLVLVLEDCHWADHSTVDLLSALAARSEPARLLVVVTYRPSDVRRDAHPLGALHQKLRLSGISEDIALELLAEDAIRAYLEARLGPAAVDAQLPALLHHQTGGNPLFLRCVIDAWIQHGALAGTEGAYSWQTPPGELARDLPESLRDLITLQLDRLSPGDRAMLRAASVAGQEFATAPVSAALALPEEEVEDRCSILAAAGQFIREAGTVDWADGTLSAAFAFGHDAYREVLYNETPPARRVRLHRLVGERLEQALGHDVANRAAELAQHFVEGRDPSRAVHYLQLAAQQAMERGAHREGVAHLTSALDVLSALEEGPQQTRTELELRAHLGNALVATEGVTGGAEHAFERALELASRLGDGHLYASVSMGLASVREFQGLHDEADRVLAAIDRGHLPADSPLALDYLAVLSCTAFHQCSFQTALDYGLEGTSSLAVSDSGWLSLFLGEDPEVGCREWSSSALWFLGFPDQAVIRVREAVSTAEQPGRWYSRASSNAHAARVHQLRCEPADALAYATTTVELAREHGFPYHEAQGRVIRGWALAALGDFVAGDAELVAGLDAHAGTGAAMDRPYFLALRADSLLAHSLLAHGQAAFALDVIEEAIDIVAGDRPFFFNAELHRLRGEALVAASPGEPDAALQAFDRARELARRQGARAAAPGSDVDRPAAGPQTDRHQPHPRGARSPRHVHRRV